jgi:hypothetical protein
MLVLIRFLFIAEYYGLLSGQFIDLVRSVDRAERRCAECDRG